MTTTHTIKKQQKDNNILDIPKILIVEDEEPLLRYLVDEFIRYSCIVLYAHDGKEGLELAQEEYPDMIVLDLLMPTMDGTTMLRKLRESDDPYIQGIPVLILTNVVDNSILDGLSKLGVVDYLIKNDRNIKRTVDIVKEKFNVSLL